MRSLGETRPSLQWTGGGLRKEAVVAGLFWARETSRRRPQFGRKGRLHFLTACATYAARSRWGGRPWNERAARGAASKFGK